MQMVMAVVSPARFEEVREALAAIGVGGMTVSEVMGFGRQKGKTEFYRGTEYEIQFRPKMRIEVAVPAERTDMVIETIREKANTGRIGDGKIFVTDLARTVRIRTGELDEEAI